MDSSILTNGSIWTYIVRVRYITTHIKRDLEKKMVFLGGPRQTGKTTLGKHLLESIRGRYFNFDDDLDRKRVLNRQWSDSEPLLVFDELHKYPHWKRWIKGIYDTEGDKHQMMVTGSARLDVYRKDGDSMVGRYHAWRLHPFSLSEPQPGISLVDSLQRLMSVGGFPEPFLDNDETSARRWRRARWDRILRDDLRDLEMVRNIQTIERFAEILKTRVSSLVVLNHIAQDLEVAQKTLKHWLELLERMYLVFSIRPLTQKIARAIHKPPKVYFFDNMDVEGDEGARFENLVATHLLKRNHYLEDRDGHRYELHFIRDKDGREVDFAVTKNKVIIELWEAKLTDEKPSRSLLYYAEKLKISHAYQVVMNARQTITKGRLSVGKPIDLLSSLEHLVTPN